MTDVFAYIISCFRDAFRLFQGDSDGQVIVSIIMSLSHSQVPVVKGHFTWTAVCLACIVV